MHKSRLQSKLKRYLALDHKFVPKLAAKDHCKHAILEHGYERRADEQSQVSSHTGCNNVDIASFIFQDGNLELPKKSTKVSSDNE